VSPLVRVPRERIRETVLALLPDVDQAVAEGIAERAAKLIASAYERDRLAFSGRKPSGTMASAIYLAGRMEKVKINQSKIGEALSVSGPTLRTGVRRIKNLLGLQVPKLPGRRERYVCPLCGEAFANLNDLRIHLLRKGIKPTSALRVRMFDDDGTLVNKEILEKMKRSLRRRTED